MIEGLFTEFAEVFVVIFVFEIFDRTNFAVLSQAARHPHLSVWAGAILGFLASTMLAIVLGGLVVSFLAPYLWAVRLAGGIVLLLFGARSLVEVHRTEESPRASVDEGNWGRSEVVLRTFSLIFLLELGDNTQVFTIVFATRFPLLLVFASAFSALTVVSGLGSLAGRHLRDRVSERTLSLVMGTLLVLTGAVTIGWALGLIPLPA